MTKDVQHDRSASPLAFVSDEIFSSPQTRSPDEPGEIAPAPESDPQSSATFDSDSFEGFGSFG
ncbi:hypothetical protein ASF49_15450 [Methylobacterium sp. Leaf104]|uniref:hypothetical protein n=1 Tax=Methylobacterium TaxID=407 RepID=UPI000701E26D|nr:MULTISPECIES: hypothetical protein [Methylobacterium]KQP29557.1 hypothetical protein ASF49_15450 [Methylobacterium sp. Leaf104]MCI9881900.1 hypothetical protein [Methylobacterium goesingense]